MIESLVSETEWIEALERIPEWHPPSRRMLVVAPHPDDETLATGGLISMQRARGVDVIVVAVTDGENAYLDSDPASPNVLRGLRQLEQIAALDRLGVGAENIVRLSLPDSHVAQNEDQLVRLLEPLITVDTHVVAPWTGDYHPDHEACGRAAAAVAQKTGAALSSFFFWTWHRDTPESLLSPRSGLQLRRFNFNQQIARVKTEALAFHQSQLIRDAGDPILPESLLGPARRSFEVFAIA